MDSMIDAARERVEELTAALHRLKEQEPQERQGDDQQGGGSCG